jgi:hypothetical protein
MYYYIFTLSIPITITYFLYRNKDLIKGYYNYKYNSNKNVKILNKNKYIIDYRYKNNDYKVRLKNKRGPSNIVSIYDELGNDIYNMIKEYLGPNEDFHNIEYSPECFEKDKIIFLLMNGNEIEFKNNEIIKLEIIPGI